MICDIDMERSVSQIIPVILSGGSGSRLWPISRESRPKQFLVINDSNYSLLQQSLLRAKRLSASAPIIVSNHNYRFLVAEQLRQIGVFGSIILEPSQRNTAPAIALAAQEAGATDELLLVLPADHAIRDEEKFEEAVTRAIPLAQSGKLVTFGVLPTEPHTGYGYIKAGASIDEGYIVSCFTEKPDLKTASEYLSGHGYYWNSGIFLFRADKYLDELRAYRGDIYEASVSSFRGATKELDFCWIDDNAFNKCPGESVDYAVMEKTSDAVVVPLDVGWSDIGSWSALSDVSKADFNGNISVGDTMLHDAKNTYVRSDDKLVAAVGVEDLVIVSTSDALLVISKHHAQYVKSIVEKLKNLGRRESQDHPEVFRPWGKYETVDSGAEYKVKRIVVNPGEKLSLQLHHRRAEHWVVVSGRAFVTNGDREYILSVNESTYIPLGTKHRLENRENYPLELIEIQTGGYLEEDDIVRFDDEYGRQ